MGSPVPDGAIVASREWSCLSCSWSSSRVPDTVVILFHRCRPDGVRRRLVELPTILDGDLETRRFDDRRSWFTSTFPKPPPPIANREPRPATPTTTRAIPMTPTPPTPRTKGGQVGRLMARHPLRQAPFFPPYELRVCAVG